MNVSSTYQHFPEHLGDITQTQFIAQSPYDYEQDDVGREFKVVEWGTSSFIESRLTVRAEKGCVSKSGFLRALLGGRGSTMRAVHQPMFLFQFCLRRSAYQKRDSSTRGRSLSSDRTVQDSPCFASVSFTLCKWSLLGLLTSDSQGLIQPG